MTLPPFQSRTRAMEAITGLLRGMHQAESGEPERESKSGRESERESESERGEEESGRRQREAGAENSKDMLTWRNDRAVSIGLIPLTIMPFAAGSLNPVMDGALIGLTIIHTYIGFG